MAANIVVSVVPVISIATISDAYAPVQKPPFPLSSVGSKVKYLHAGTDVFIVEIRVLVIGSTL